MYTETDLIFLLEESIKSRDVKSCDFYINNPGIDIEYINSYEFISTLSERKDNIEVIKTITKSKNFKKSSYDMLFELAATTNRVDIIEVILSANLGKKINTVYYEESFIIGSVDVVKTFIDNVDIELDISKIFKYILQNYEESVDIFNLIIDNEKFRLSRKNLHNFMLQLIDVDDYEIFNIFVENEYYKDYMDYNSMLDYNDTLLISTYFSKNCQIVDKIKHKMRTSKIEKIINEN